MLAARFRFCYNAGIIHNMKTFAKSACFVLLSAWAGSAICMAQANPPAAAATNPPAAVKKMTNRRFSGKILTVDSKAKIIYLQGDAKVGIGITDTTRIILAKKPATFDVLNAGDPVTGVEQLGSDGKWLAQTVNVGDQRQVLAEPVPKKVVAPPIPPKK